MPIASVLEGYARTLEDIQAVLGLVRDKIRKAEAVDRFSLDVTRAPADLARIDQAKLDGWFAVFGETLRLDSVLEGNDGDPRAHWTAEWRPHDAEKLRQHRAYCDQLEDPKLRLSIEFDKAPIIGELRNAMVDEGASEASAAALKMFFFGEVLCGTLTGDYLSFEELFLDISNASVPIRDRQLLILVADRGGRIQGPFFGILGIDRCNRFAELFAVAPPFEREQRARETMQDITWDDRPEVLTPGFLAVGPAAEAGALADCYAEIMRLQNHLAVGFLANSSRQEKGRWLSTFEGSRSVTIEMGVERASTGLYSLYQWAYDPEAASARLEIVRRVIAARLPPERSEGFAVLARTSKDLLSECRLQFDLLIDKSIAESFRYQQEAEEAVRRYVDGVAEHIQALTKEVVDNAYKTVGLLVGIIIAYLLEPARSPVVLVLGTGGYVAYILFVRFFYLSSYKKDLCGRKTAFLKKRHEIAAQRTLRPSVLSRLDKEIKKQEEQFSAQYKRVSCLYFTFCGLALLFLGGWFGFQCLAPGTARNQEQTLEKYAKQLKALRYEVRAQLKEWDAPDLIVDSTGQAFAPELTAIPPGPASNLIIAEFVGCRELRKPDTLRRLRGLEKMADERKAEVHILTQEVCGGNLGPRRLRQWLKANRLPDWSLWAP